MATILPHLQKQLKSENWRMREAAILAIGAMATGCIDGARVFSVSFIECTVSEFIVQVVLVLNDNECNLWRQCRNLSQLKRHALLSVPAARTLMHPNAISLLSVLFDRRPRP